MQEEGLKDPNDEEGSDQEQQAPMDDPANPAAEDTTVQPQHNTIYTQENRSERVARQLQQQQDLYAQFNASHNADVDDELARGLQGVGISSSPEAEETWTCGNCGLDCPLCHRFCGICGTPKPENWLCTHCDYENQYNHNFCGICGRRELQLDYEDMGMDPDDEAAIQETALRMPYNDDDDEELTFADDCSEGVQQQNAPSPPPDASWSCEVCTYLNENPMFMCCEM